MIESVMLVALGFLLSTLLAVIVAPAFWARAVRLTTSRIKSALPVTEAEIRADKDQLRAQYAVRVHQLERSIEESRLSAARQLIELNRRDQTIAEMKDAESRLSVELEENQNARRVLEQTINDRLPKLESRLEEARRLLHTRDHEIMDLSNRGHEMEHALAEAEAINTQQAQEMDRLRIAISARHDHDRRRHADGLSEADFALRNELTTLRNRAREQAGLIERLRSDATRVQAAGAQNGFDSNGTLVGATAVAGAQAARDFDVATLQAHIAEQDLELEELRRKLTEAEVSGTPGAAQELAELRGELRIRDDEISNLRAEVDMLRAISETDGSTPDDESRTTLRSKLVHLEHQLNRETGTSQRLKAELTAANERAARQAAHFMDEMKRFGARSGGQVETAAASPAADKGQPHREPEQHEPTRHEPSSDAPDRPSTGPQSGDGDEQVLASPPAKETEVSPTARRLLERLRSYE